MAEVSRGPADTRPDGPPVTFGDLWGADRGERATSADSPRQIELVLKGNVTPSDRLAFSAPAR